MLLLQTILIVKCRVFYCFANKTLITDQRQRRVSLDYLVGKTDLELDNDTLKRVAEISKMSKEDKGHVYAFLDAFIAKTRLHGFV